jgi:hypothetical protein
MQPFTYLFVCIFAMRMNKNQSIKKTMKKKIYLLLPVIAVFMLTAFGIPGSSDNPDHSNGAPAGYTGSPADAKNCTQCHGGSATTQAGLITSNIPAQGYTAGSSYTITVSLSGSGNKGFEVSPQTVAGALLGTLVAGTGSKLVGSGKYCTHSAAVGGSSATWNFTWVAPVAGTGTVTFYGAMVITEPVTKLSTLVVNEYTYAPLSIVATATPATICSGQSSQLNVAASGGSGNYTYSWTSIPVGFTSNIQNPVVYPTQTTQYVSHVSDGTQSLTDTTHVTVNAPPAAAAGNDTTYCVSVADIPLHGIASGYSSVLWTTNGDGTFVNATSLNTIYHPGAGDKTNLVVNLTLTASPLAPCANAAASTRIIHFDPCGVGIPGLTGYTFTFSLRPNPSTGIFTIYSSSVKNEDVMIRIIDLGGKIVLNEKLMVSGENMESRMDLTGLAKGIYFVRLETSNGVKTEKLILQ